ncbi:MAG TPA: hypothetical protein VGU20_31005 [Stellaceae bacterium]|nr:hypothetical protein [Terriglobia bacterium]HEV2551780.1 hypothetical protein [Stellaceae bacterium]
MSAVDYIPHGIVTALATVVGFVFRQHVKQDEDRFQELTVSIAELGKKLDAVNQNAADRHADLVNTLLLTKR